MADAPDLGSGAFGREGSTPSSRTAESDPFDPTAAPRHAAGVRQSQRPLSVLLVDDTEPIRRLARFALDADPRFLVAGESATAGDAIATAARTRPDVVLLDLSLLTGEETETIDQLHASAPGSLVIVLSGHLADTHERRAFEYGADGYLEKGADMWQLPELLAATLEGRVR